MKLKHFFNPKHRIKFYSALISVFSLIVKIIIIFFIIILFNYTLIIVMPFDHYVYKMLFTTNFYLLKDEEIIQ